MIVDYRRAPRGGFWGSLEALLWGFIIHRIGFDTRIFFVLHFGLGLGPGGRKALANGIFLGQKNAWAQLLVHLLRIFLGTKTILPHDARHSIQAIQNTFERFGFEEVNF